MSTVNFNNVLKRGNLQVIKSSEDNLVEGVTFQLYGISLAGIAVDEYAVTDKNGIATFKDVLISGSTPYTIEEVDTAIRYVVPEKQTAPIKWNEVTNRDFTNILKKFSVTVTKSDREEGTAQGDAKLSGAVYGIYKGETLVDKYVTDSDGQFTTKEYICDSDWTIREITPSEGYLLDKTVHKVTLGELMPMWWGDERYKTEDITYREAVPADAALLVDIYDRAFRSDYIRYGECPAYGRTVERMKYSILNHPKEIIICGGTPVGVISADDCGEGNYRIGCLCVVPEYQCRGIGGRAIEHFRAVHPDWRRIDLVTPADKTDNISFYRKNGFEVSGTESDGNVIVVKLFCEKKD